MLTAAGCAAVGALNQVGRCRGSAGGRPLIVRAGQFACPWSGGQLSLVLVLVTICWGELADCP